MLLSLKSSSLCNSSFSELTQDLLTQSVLESRKLTKKAFQKPWISSPTNIPTYKFHTGVRWKNVQYTTHSPENSVKNFLPRPGWTFLAVLARLFSAATVVKKNYCSLWWCVQWCRGSEQRIYSSYISAIAQGRTNRIAKAEKRLNLAQCLPNMYHLIHSVLANTPGYCASSLSKKFHQINRALPSHSRLQATRFLSIEAMQQGVIRKLWKGPFSGTDTLTEQWVLIISVNISHLPFTYNPLSYIWSLRASEFQSRNPISCLEFSLFYIEQLY